MQKMMNSPLLEIAMSSVNEVCNNIDMGLNLKIRKKFSEFINGTISRTQMQQFLLSSIRNVQPLEKIEMILSIPDEPIPSNNADENTISTGRRTRTWTQFEDLRLIAAVHRHGHENWAIIAKYVGNGRTRSQCSQRWHRGLDPRISKEQWTQRDDEKLIQLITSNGLNGWSQIARAMGNRSDVHCRYHYFQLKKEIESLGHSFPIVEETNHNFFDDPLIWIKDDD